MEDVADDKPQYISPQYTAAKVSPGTFADWVDVWEDRMWGWWLARADALKGQRDGAFLTVHIAVGMIEALEVAYQGKDSDGATPTFFRNGFQRMFSAEAGGPVSHSDAANVLYKAVRCALTHTAMLYGPVFLTDEEPWGPVAIIATPDGRELKAVVIHTAKFLGVVILGFRRYVEMLRTGQGPEADERRRRFEDAWHALHAKTLPPPLPTKGK